MKLIVDYLWQNHREHTGKGTMPCCICGRLMDENKAKKWLKIANGGNTVVTEDEVVMPEGDMGMYPIGPDCLKKHPELLKFILQV